MTDQVSTVQQDFSDVAQLISAACNKAYRIVNTTCVSCIGKSVLISAAKSSLPNGGDGVIAELANYLAATWPG